MTTLEIRSEITGNVWQVEATVGSWLEEDAPLLILESMKMEIPVVAPEPGRLVELHVGEGQPVGEGDVLALMEVE